MPKPIRTPSIKLDAAIEGLQALKKTFENFPRGADWKHDSVPKIDVLKNKPPGQLTRFRRRLHAKPLTGTGKS